MYRNVKVASVSWINETPSPIWFAGKAALLEPEWIPKTYLGLTATANNPPPSTIRDFSQFRATKDFRALSYCHLGLHLDDKTQQIITIDVLDSFFDAGWTPPFKVRKYPSTGVRFWDTDIWSWDWQAGEASSRSAVTLQARHENTSIDAPISGDVLVNALVKFRAGSKTDRIGTQSVGCPFHVPWVWCETLLTYANGRFTLCGRGSLFPSHTWYLDGKAILSAAQVSDTTFPHKKTVVHYAPYPGASVSIPRPLVIEANLLNLYPVLSAGAPAISPQSTLAAEFGLRGAVGSHRYTVSAGTMRKAS